MFPGLPPQNSLNIGMGYSEKSSKLSATITTGRHFSDFLNLIFYKFGFMVIFAKWDRPMLKLIFGICKRGIPTKIFKKTVSRVSVSMAGLQPPWARADEGIKNELVNSNDQAFTMFAKLHVWITIFGFAAPQYFSRLGIHHPSRLVTLAIRRCFPPIRPYASMVRRFVSVKTRDWFPNLDHSAYILCLADNANYFYGLGKEGEENAL